MNQAPTDPATIYDQDYYDHYGSVSGVPYNRDEPTWKEHFSKMAAAVVERYHPRTVLDVGCAKGFLVEHLRDAKVEACGVDVSPYAISKVREDLRPYFRVAGGAERLTGQYDLITCIEVAEHMPEPEAKAMVAEFCRHTDQVIFSSTPDGFNEPTHINIHPREYWLALFQQHGFYPDGNFQPDFIAPQAMRLLRCRKPTLQVAVFSHEPPNCAVALLRLAGTIRHLERRNRLHLQWCTARDPRLDAEKLLNCDLFVVHREFADHGIRRNVMAAAQALGKPVVFELDDLLINVPKSNPNHKYCAAITPHILSMLCEADFVTVTTEPLRRYLEEAEPMAKGKTYVLPNYINLDIWDGAKPPPTKPPEPFVIGWFGTATHYEDLAIIKPAIVEMARKYAGKLVFKFWGYLPKDLEGIPGVQLVRGSQPDLRLHARDVVNSRIDLALAPLLDHPFNHAKSDLKWLEYSICYIPAIYSTISPYAGSVKHGQTGWLVDNQPELWMEAIELLMRDHELRRKIAMQAHDEVRQTRCVKTGAEFWDALYRSFHVSGPKPHPAETEAVAAPRDRAAAHLLLHQASALAKSGQNVEAAKICEQAIAKYIPADSMIGELVNTVLRNYRNVFGEMQETTDLTARLNAAKSVASAGQTRVAVQLYVQTLQAAKQSHNPLIVFRAVLEVARALRALNPELGRPLLDLGATLSRNLPIQDGVRAIEQLRADYNRTQQPAKPPKQIKSVKVIQDTAVKVPAKILSANTGKSSSDTSNTQQPAVSIVIPTFNNLSLTQGCLQSLAQMRTTLQYEIIVVDNASTDSTLEFLREQEKTGSLRLIANSTNQGFARACNQGATAARGRHVLFLNNDTQPTPGWLDPLVRTVDADPKVVAVGAKLIFPDSTIQHAGVVITDDRRHGDSLLAQHVFYRRPQDFPEANEARTYQALTAACLLVRRETFQKLGGFDEEFWNGYEDVDLCFRISAVGGTLVYQPESVVIHHESKGGPERFRNARQNIARLHAKWQGKIEPDFVVSSDGQATQVGTAKITRYQIPSVAVNQPPRLASIVILAFNQLEHTRKCVTSVLAHTRAPFEVIFVDNASTDGTAEYLAGLCRQHSNFKVITNRKNLGFAAGNNQGLAVAKGDVLILLNNDTIVTPGWLEGLTAALQAEGSVGLAGPVSNRISGPQLVSADYASDDAMFEFAKSWAAQNEGRTQPVTKLVGFCLAFKRTVLDAIGGLDECFGSGNFEDDDYCLRARFAGFSSCIARGVFIHHTGSQTFKGAQINYRQAMLRNWDLFRMKWHLPADASLERGYPIPTSKPETVSLHIALPSLGLTHKMDGQIFRTEQTLAKTTKKAEVPPVFRLGNLDKARSLFGQRHFESAWNEVIAALRVRPFHPEAALLLAEIALAAGDGNSARQCAQHARNLVSGWKAPKQCLQKPLKGNARLGWLKLPESIQGLKSNGPSLSVCLIVKNEEKFLSQCLNSVRGLASQIVVVDTGSTDRTVEIAKEHGAEIYHTAWSDDFSAARNAALERATGDWVLMLDADEELPADQHANLRNDMKQADAVAFRIPLVNRGEEGQGHSYVPRLFRNLSGAYYYGRIHEQVFPSLIAASKGWGMATRLGTARILHHGYAGDIVKDRSKVERNLCLLRQAVTEYPDDANLVMNLGLELVHSGDLTTGLKHYRDAFRLMSAQLPSGVVPELREVLLTQLTCHLYQVRAHDEIVQTLNSPLAKHGGLTASLHFALALAQFELKQFHETAEHMRQCLAKRGEPTFAPLNSDIHTAAPHHCLAVALARLGDNAEAEKSFQAGLKEKGRIEELRLDYAKFLTDQGRPVEALHQLHEIVQHQPQHAAAWRFGGEIALSKPDFLEFARDWTTEAIRHLSDDGVIVAQRAEVLMLSQDVSAALPLWARAINGKRPPQALAARIICATAGSQPIEGLQDHAEETAVSHAFVNWYRRLVSAGARDTIFRLNSQVETLRPVLPSAATMLDGVIASMRKSNVVETVAS